MVSQLLKDSASSGQASTTGQGVSTPSIDTDSRIVIGVDEAGYGPNIGPLLIAGTAWRIPKAMDEHGFSQALGTAFHTQAWCENCQHVPLGDSKQLYSTSSGLRTLEAGLMAMLGQLPDCQACNGLASLLQTIDTSRELWSDNARAQRLAWYAQVPQELTCEVPRAEVTRLAQLAQYHLANHGIQLLAVRSMVVFESRYNALIARLGSKGRLLSTLTMELVGSLLTAHMDQEIEVFCDRQGGRKKYACVLLEAMPDDWFDTLLEQNERSSYRRQRQPGLTFHFSVGGDSFPPTALASMTAKYLRERLMAGINHYWQSHVSGLAPTAGYPQDAKRYRAQIESTALKLGHSIEQWWRIC